MAFTTLADRFEQKSKEIYSRFSPSSGQLVTVKPDTEGVFGSRSRIKNDNRSIPTVSVLRDTQRVSKFLASAEGVLFLTKQALLQTGNTFVNTKLYNPASPLLNVVPFLHTRRHIPTQEVTGAAPGLLQNTTVNNVTSKFVVSGQLQALSTGGRGLLPTIGSIAKTYLATQLKNAANTIVPLPQTYLGSRPEYRVFTDAIGPIVFAPQPLDQRGKVLTTLSANVKDAVVTSARRKLVSVTTAALNRALPKSLRNNIPLPLPLSSEPQKIPTFVKAAKDFRKNFYDRQLRKFRGDSTNSRMKNKYFYESDNGFADTDENPSTKTFGTAKPTSYYPTDKGLKSTLKDPYNIAPFAPTFEENTISYRNITKERDKNTDIIRFIFSDVDGNNPVYFRALLSSIKESIKPEFNEQRYVGRTERFVTYGGVKRGVSLTFNIVAFSPDERDGMWTKVNYLSGLTFPKEIKNGFMVPPLFKITIGGIYDNQPCYIESLDYDFLDESITFDIDKEVPFAINVTMQLSILEKRSKFSDSPFYKITEDTGKLVFQRLGSAATTTTIAALPNTAVTLPKNLGSLITPNKFPITGPTIAELNNLGIATDESGEPIP